VIKKTLTEKTKLIKMKNLFYVVFIVCSFSSLSFQVKIENMNEKEEKCDSVSLLEVAKKAIIKEYGKRTFNFYKPYKISEYNDTTLMIDGTIHTKKGGSPTVFIDKKNCTITRITHYK
jgi:hypothetical protein